MAAKIAQEVIDEIRDSCDIVQLIGDYVRLQKSGKSFKGLCPFHNERTPSFNVNGEKGLYYCFGCGAGGDIINFVMEMEKLSFGEAVEFLARRFGLPLPEASPQRDDGRDELLAICAKATEFYQRCLWESPRGEVARRYLQKRGIAATTAREFQLGFAPYGRGYLWNYLRKAGYSLQAAVEAGLVAIGRRNTPYDRFRNRLIFPIANRRGRVIGFGGRALGEGGGPKYLNSPETPLFNKRKILYGLHLARKGMRSSEEAIIVEGYMDVIALHQAGHKEAVSSLGTALTEDQVELLRRETRRALIAYDADAAGQKATLRGLEVLENKGMDVRLIELPKGEDPDSFVSKGGDFASLRRHALPLIDYRLKLAIGAQPKDPASRAEAVQRVIPILAGINNVAVREVYVGAVAERLGISGAALGTELEKYKGKSGKTSRYRHTTEQTSYNSKDAMADPPLVEMELVRLMLENPQLVDQVAEKVGVEDFTHAGLRHIVAKILQRRAAGYTTLPQDIAQDAQVHASGILAHLVREEPGLATKEILDNCILRMKQYRLSAILASLEKELGKEIDSVRFLDSLLIRYKDLKDSIGNC